MCPLTNALAVGFSSPATIRIVVAVPAPFAEEPDPPVHVELTSSTAVKLPTFDTKLIEIIYYLRVAPPPRAAAAHARSCYWRSSARRPPAAAAALARCE
jgi:hypothetical protein